MLCYFNLGAVQVSHINVQALWNLLIVLIYLFGKTTDCDWSAWNNDGLMKTSQTVENYAQEKYVDVTDPTVLELHKARVDLAHQIGCDGLDPDNIDTFVCSPECLLPNEADP